MYCFNLRFLHIKQIFDIITPDDFSLPKVKNLERIANRVREDLRPQEPKDLDFVVTLIHLHNFRLKKIKNCDQYQNESDFFQ
jgi:hypothetical protein